MSRLPDEIVHHPLLEWRYRPNATAVIVNAQGAFLWCERLDFAGSYQFPQGGIDHGETAEQAMWREVGEELGVIDVRSAFELLRAAPESICYEFPEALLRRALEMGRRTGLGQEQWYFLLRLIAEESVITLEPPPEAHREFRSVCWGGAEFLESVVAFKRGAVEAGMRALGVLDAP